MTVVPQPRKTLTVEEFLATLDQGNPAFNRISEIFKECDSSIMRIYKKDASLYEMVMGSLSPHRLPIVDKPLQVVVEARDDHQNLTGGLFCYHYAGGAPPNNDPDIYDSRIWGQLYYERGYGYYFTGAWGRSKDVMIGERYRPDNFDKDIMIELGLK